MRKTKNSVLLLGKLDNDSITTAIKVNDCDYIRKDFRSSASNWQMIAELLENSTSAEIPCVLVKLTEDTLINCVRPSYSEAFDRICLALKSHKHIIFIYSDNLSGEFFKDEDNADWQRLAGMDAEKIRVIKDEIVGARLKGLGWGGNVSDFIGHITGKIQNLHDLDLNLVPYQTTVDQNISAQEFIEESFRGLLLRIYIPSSRIWAGEVDKLLNLFQDYLRKVQSFPVTLDERQTESGLIYGFYCADNSVDTNMLTSFIGEFTSFIDVASNNPNQAEKLLHSKHIPDNEVRAIVQKYAKEGRRLMLDIEHERQECLLRIRHRLESELLDTATNYELNSHIAKVEIEKLPSSFNPFALMQDTPAQASMVIQNQNITIHNSQFISNVGDIVSQEINGNVVYSEHDKELLRLFELHAAGTEKLELQSSLLEIKDDAVPHSQRVTAWQQTRKFLSKHSQTIEKAALTVLEKYIDHLIAKS